MARKKKAPEASKPVLVHGFKGFTKDLKCRDKQYALGETFEESEASLCNHGLHFCEYPLDCFGYYEPGLIHRIPRRGLIHRERECCARFRQARKS